MIASHAMHCVSSHFCPRSTCSQHCAVAHSLLVSNILMCAIVNAGLKMMRGWMRCWTSLKSACQRQAQPAVALLRPTGSSQHQQQAGALQAQQLEAASSQARGQSSSSNSSSEGWG
jgi:hypothetical protein